MIELESKCGEIFPTWRAWNFHESRCPKCQALRRQQHEDELQEFAERFTDADERITNVI